MDNWSIEKSVEVLREICRRDKCVKVIVNTRNFGHIRSGYHALLQAKGDAMIAMASDLQDPPEMIEQFIRKWEEGYKVVLAQKLESEESPLFFLVRKMYYNFVNRLSEIPLVKNVTGFGLYDAVVTQKLREDDDPYPYFRGLICHLSYQHTLVPLTHPLRKH